MLWSLGPPLGRKSLDLVFRGGEWQLGAEEVEVPEVRLDWQHGMLLEIKGRDGAGIWAIAARSGAPLKWLDLRRAVYSRARLPRASRTKQGPAQS